MIAVIMKGWGIYEHVGLAVQFARAYRTAGKVARAAADKATDRMVKDMKAGVAVDRGALRESIRKERLNKKTIVIRAGGTPETMHPYGGGQTFDEAVAVEFGTTKMPAQPFFYPVVDRARENIERDMGSEVDDAMSSIRAED